MALPTAQLLDDDCARRESALARLAGNPHLPSPPGIVLQILDKASRLDCTPTDLVVLIHRVVREGDIVARYGGDEFCILV